MNIEIGDVKTFLWDNRIWVVVALIVVVGVILWPVLLSPLNEQIEEETDSLERDEKNLAKYANMSPQTIPDDKVLAGEKKYLKELQTQLEKMRQGLGKGDFEWTIGAPEPGEKYPDPRKFKLEYGKKKDELIEEAEKSPVRFDSRTLKALFWNIQGDPSPGQMLAAQKEFSIIKGLLDIITEPKMAVSSVRTLSVSVNPRARKSVPFRAVKRIVPKGPDKKQPGEGAAVYKSIQIKLALEIDFRTLYVLIDEILRSPYKINPNIRLIRRLGRIGDRTVQPLVYVDMDMESVDFNPTL